jgi:MFS transporter, UMF1 family
MSTSMGISTPATPPDRPAYRKRWLAWAMYDWANSAVVTLVIAAVFPIFYNSVAEVDLHANAATAFSFTVTVALLLSAIAGPVVGTLADIVGGRKRLLVVSTILGVVAVCAMYSIRSGGWLWASILFVVVQIFLNTALALYDSLLSHIALPQDRDRISAIGYALGYVGGGLLLAIALALILKPQILNTDTETATRIGLLLSGIWWLVFAVPLFLVVPEPPAAPLEKGATGNPLNDTFKRMGNTFRAIRSYRELFKMLIAFWLYSDGIGTIIQLATTYGKQQIGLDQSVLIGALLLTQFVAFPFSVMFGRIPNRASQNRSFYVAFILWTVITFPIMGVFAAANNVGTGTTFALIAANQVIGLIVSWFVGRNLAAGLTEQLTTKRSVIFGLAIYGVISIWAFFLYTAAEFWMLAWLVGTVQGGTQALSRSLYASLTPHSKSGEFFGFYGFSDKFAGILGPLLFGVVSALTGGNLRFAILSVVIFFAAGGFLLSRVNEAEGQRVAESEDAAIGYHDDLPDASAAAPAAAV